VAVVQGRHRLCCIGQREKAGIKQRELVCPLTVAAIQEEQLSMRQKIRDDFAKFCAREQAS
jgi:hypothetical protein